MEGSLIGAGESREEERVVAIFAPVTVKVGKLF